MEYHTKLDNELNQFWMLFKGLLVSFWPWFGRLRRRHEQKYVVEKTRIILLIILPIIEQIGTLSTLILF